MISPFVERYFAELAYVSARLPVGQITEAVQHIVAARARGSTVFTIGNGGSAATASHFVCDLIKYGHSAAEGALRAHALTDAVSVLTAIANDSGYENVFADQLAVYATSGDVVIAISGSGNSPNVLRCVQLARSLGLLTIAFAGFAGGRLAQLADLAIVVPGSRIQVVEDAHSTLCHAVALAVGAAVNTDTMTTIDATRAAVFCDRDGVLNVRRPDHVKNVAEFEFLPGALEALAELGATGVPVAVVTNQSIIGRGLAPMHEVDAIHQWMQEVVSAHGGPQLAIYVCPHAPEDSCECRKPRPGLLLQAAAELHVDLTQSVFVGDGPSDVAAALAVGCRSILVGATPLEQTAWPANMVSCVPTLIQAVRLMHERLPPLAASDYAHMAHAG